MNKILKISLILLAALGGNSFGQKLSDPKLLTIGYHNGNRVGISFYNDGELAGFNTGIDIRGEWPLGSGSTYIGDATPLIGVEFTNTLGKTIHQVDISRGPRNGQGTKRRKDSRGTYFWGFNPLPGFRNPNYGSVAMSHITKSWPIGGWSDSENPDAKNWVDKKGNTEWDGYFGRGVTNATQESFFEANDDWSDQYNDFFHPDSTNLSRTGMALTLHQRGFQWSSFLAQNAIFWLYDIINTGTTIYHKTDFGEIIGTLAASNSTDNLGYFDVVDWVTYSWGSTGVSLTGQKAGYVGYAYLESPGDPYDGIDNDHDCTDPNAPRFTEKDFGPIIYNAGDQVILINPTTYERTRHTVKGPVDTVYSLGHRFIIEAGKTIFQEGAAKNLQGVYVPDSTANDGLDNNLNGLIDENEAIHYFNWTTKQKYGPDGKLVADPQLPCQHKDYIKNLGMDPYSMIDERRDDGLDNNKNWSSKYDDLGADGLGKNDTGYPGPDMGESDGKPTEGEPDFDRTDPEESDQIGLTAFNFFQQSSSPDMSKDSIMWARMVPGRYDVVPPSQPQDGDFIYASGYFPLFPKQTERFSIAFLFGEDYDAVRANKKTVLKIYDAGYKFPKPPVKPKVTATEKDGKVILYWDGDATENTPDFITKVKNFEGYKIYRATEENFRDSKTITNALGVLQFDKPVAQFDKIDSVKGIFYPSKDLLAQYGGTSYNLGDETGLVHTYSDSSVIKGVTYYYAVCAYTTGDESKDIFPEEDEHTILRKPSGALVTDDNTCYITPGASPAGYVAASVKALTKSSSFWGTGKASVNVIDDKAIKNGHNYQIVFQDDGKGYTKNWSLLDKDAPDTVYIAATGQTTIVRTGGLDSLLVPKGTDTITVNGKKLGFKGPQFYRAPYDTLVERSTLFNGLTPIKDGFNVQLYNDPIKLDTLKSGFSGLAGTSPQVSYQVWKWPIPKYTGVMNVQDYQVEFYKDNVSQSMQDTIPGFPKNFGAGAGVIPSVPVNVKIKNMTTGQYIGFDYWALPGTVTSYNFLFREPIAGKTQRTWSLSFLYTGTKSLETQGKYNFNFLRPFIASDKYDFTMEGASSDRNLAKAELSKIKVVPNPYVVTHQGEPALQSFQTSGRGERFIQFTHVPFGAKVSIYTIRGELVKTLHQDNLYDGAVKWNLRTEENLDAAFGVYIYVVDAPGVGTRIDKFALIK